MSEQITTPRFEYSRADLKAQAGYFKSLSAPFGLDILYAVKANPHPEVIKIFKKRGLLFDASSEYEALQLLEAGVPGKRIQLSSQQSSKQLGYLLRHNVRFIATSKHQLDLLLAHSKCPKKLAVRINPGIGSGYNNRVTTGGPNASFGIWHEYIPEVLGQAEQAGKKITSVQIHVGTGGKPHLWAETTDTALRLLLKLPDVRTLSVGGGFKTGYHPDEEDADMEEILDQISDRLEDFHDDRGRKIRLQIEPGRALVASAGRLVASIDDIVDTGSNGHTFLRLNTGMNDFLRTTMYGSHHRISVENDSTQTQKYVVVGHNCETGDTLTTALYDPETIEERELNSAQIGDRVVIHDTGAYCASMSAKGYNGFPDAAEVMVD